MTTTVTGEHQHEPIANVAIGDFTLTKKDDGGGSDTPIDNIKLITKGEGDYTISLVDGKFGDGLYQLIFEKEHFMTARPMGCEENDYFEISVAKSQAKALINGKSVDVAYGEGEDKTAVLAAIKALDKTGNTLIAALTTDDIEIEENRATVDFGGGITAEVTIIEVD